MDSYAKTEVVTEQSKNIYAEVCRRLMIGVRIGLNHHREHGKGRIGISLDEPAWTDLQKMIRVLSFTANAPNLTTSDARLNEADTETGGIIKLILLALENQNEEASERFSDPLVQDMADLMRVEMGLARARDRLGVERDRAPDWWDLEASLIDSLKVSIGKVRFSGDLGNQRFFSILDLAERVNKIIDDEVRKENNSHTYSVRLRAVRSGLRAFIDSVHDLQNHLNVNAALNPSVATNHENSISDVNLNSISNEPSVHSDVDLDEQESSVSLAPPHVSMQQQPNSPVSSALPESADLGTPSAPVISESSLATALNKSGDPLGEALAREAANDFLRRLPAVRDAYDYLSLAHETLERINALAIGKDPVKAVIDAFDGKIDPAKIGNMSGAISRSLWRVEFWRRLENDKWFNGVSNRVGAARFGALASLFSAAGLASSSDGNETVLMSEFDTAIKRYFGVGSLNGEGRKRDEGLSGIFNRVLKKGLVPIHTDEQNTIAYTERSALDRILGKKSTDLELPKDFIKRLQDKSPAASFSIAGLGTDGTLKFRDLRAAGSNAVGLEGPEAADQALKVLFDVTGQAAGPLMAFLTEEAVEAVMEMAQSNRYSGMPTATGGGMIFPFSQPENPVRVHGDIHALSGNEFEMTVRMAQDNCGKARVVANGEKRQVQLISLVPEESYWQAWFKVKVTLNDGQIVISDVNNISCSGCALTGLDRKDFTKALDRLKDVLSDIGGSGTVNPRFRKVLEDIVDIDRRLNNDGMRKKLIKHLFFSNEFRGYALKFIDKVKEIGTVRNFGRANANTKVDGKERPSNCSALYYGKGVLKWDMETPIGKLYVDLLDTLDELQGTRNPPV